MPTSIHVKSPMTRPSPSAAPVRVPLTQLKRGDRAIVEMESLGRGESRLLEAMGLCDRAEVRVCRAGTPCIVQIEATRLGISADVASRILCVPCRCLDEDAAHDA
jgi:Fe2+ transport system protein FeoA